MTSTAQPVGARRKRVLGAAAAGAFASLVVGSNVPGPLLPLYADRMSLSTFAVSALFAVYLVALVITFTVMARTRLTRYAWALLPAAMLGGVVADLSLLAGGESVMFLFLGRFLTGTCVGVATGATATIVVAARGEKGRTIASSGAIFGSFVGLILGAVVAEYLPGPTTTVYLVHMTLLTVVAVVLVIALYSARETLRVALHEPVVGGTPESEPPVERRARAAGYGIGLAGWAIGGIAVGILPTAVREQTGSESLVVGALAPVVLLSIAWLSPFVFAALQTALRPVQSLALIGLGAVLCAMGVVLASLPMVIAGCVCWGLGQGFAYACGLRILTRGLSAVEQGRTASRFASFCYGLTAVLALGTGAVSTAWGTGAGMTVAGVVFVALCTTVAILGRDRWDVPKAAESPVSQTVAAPGAV
ncbi:MFS transporter [Rhodococcoides yunnanense]|uniref:MFS transporter n=1 Tax=Rhodococcoides yunnanense TaxID=278209 RepID=A0ABU4BEZ1_9NOCA|nr:MFS transporter [Rhodococcus yunnanensis]MDV6262759.1 MFS transporter [Rhodococcus yunnanensis]